MTTEQIFPSVSIVMAVYDQADLARKTISSVLAQDSVDLELIIVSDGAAQEVLDVIEAIHDKRIRLIKQKNAGLTRALMNGCKLAKYDYIARIDAGDTMLAGRLNMQSKYLDENPAVGMVSSWVKMHTTEGYFLYDICHSAEDLRKGLSARKSEEFISPFHASMMFRKSAYLQAGGYRAEFYFTQDCDLWTRMLRSADIGNIDKYLTSAIFSANGISGQYADFQKQLVHLVVKGNFLSENGLSDHEIFEQANKLRPNGDAADTTESQRVNTLYFIASILSSLKSPHAKEYWRKVLQLKPLSIVSRLRWLASLRYSGE